MTLTRWEPIRDLLGIQRELGQLFGEWNESDAVLGWAPAVDIIEQGDDLVIRAELAGVEADDIDIRVEDNALILRGERKQEQELSEARSYRRERTFGSFTRRFVLPATVDPSRISARHKNGVLEITLPKLEEAKPRKVDIKVA